jgi:hypothetical protein
MLVQIPNRQTLARGNPRSRVSVLLNFILTFWKIDPIAIELQPPSCLTQDKGPKTTCG